MSKVEQDDPPTIPEVCREAGFGEEDEIKQARRLASRENWEAHRRKRMVKVQNALAKHEDALIDKLAVEMTAQRETFLREAIGEINNLLPKMLAELEARVESGWFDDKALVQAIKLLMDSRKSVVDTIQKEFSAKDPKESPTDDPLKMLRDLGLLARLVDVVNGDVQPQALAIENYAQISDMDQRHAEALDILDAEVISEE